MTVRQLLWGLVLIFVLVAAWQFLRALRLGRAAMTVAQPAAQAEPVALPASKRSDGPERNAADTDLDDDDGDGFDYAAQLRPLRASPAAPPPLPSAPVAPAPEVFHLELELRHLRRELDGQQELIALQRAEIEALQSELGNLHLQLADAVVAQPTTSPEYSEAMQLARQGRSAEEIASRCGITVAEAGLVLSLARTGGARR